MASSSPAAVGSFPSFVSTNAPSIPCSPAHPELERLDRVQMRRREWSGRIDLARALHVDLLALDEAAELRLEIRLLEPRRRQRRREVLADLRRIGRDRADLGAVRRVGRLRVVAGAALRPHREKHDERDREHHEPDEAQKRRQTVGRAELRPPRASTIAPPATAGTAAFARSRGLTGTRRRRELPRRLIDEVEVEDVVVVNAHGVLRR